MISIAESGVISNTLSASERKSFPFLLPILLVKDSVNKLSCRWKSSDFFTNSENGTPKTSATRLHILRWLSKESSLKYSSFSALTSASGLLSANLTRSLVVSNSPPSLYLEKRTAAGYNPSSFTKVSSSFMSPS